MLDIAQIGNWKQKKERKELASPELEPETFSVLDWRDNQLHHDTLDAAKFQIPLF